MSQAGPSVSIEPVSYWVASLPALEQEQIQPASVDLRLGFSYLKVKQHQVGLMSLNEEIQYEHFENR
ncbi:MULTISPECIES: hypothetical protein [Priestia]|nr:MULTISPECIES: hypothetical protein [Priestia]MED3822606.1 hypothetical protein [Priestia flexa]